MKKMLLLAVAAILCCTAYAGEMNLRTPNGEQPIVADMLENMQASEFLPGAAYCRYLPQGDQQEKYYMVLSFLNSDSNPFPQLQMHILVADTMAISREGNIFLKATYLQTETTGGNATGANVKLDFLQFDTIAGNIYAKYDVVATITFDKHEPITTMYRGYITFISDATNTTYVPLHEPNDLAVENVFSTLRATKIYRDGQLIIETAHHRYSPLGQLLQ